MSKSKQTITADEAVEQLVREGHSRPDVIAVIESLINAGLDAEQVDDNVNLLNDTDMQVVREQLNASR